MTLPVESLGFIQNETCQKPGTGETSTYSILVVDDDDVLRSRLRRAFERRGYLVFCADGFEAAIVCLKQQSPTLAVLDLKMPGKSGIELLVELRKLSPDTKVVLLTGYGSIANAVDAIKLGAVNYVTKPADADQILAAFESGADSDESEFSPPSLAQAQWEHIQRVLADCDGNISAASHVLDIPRRTLQRKLKKMLP